jgi:hypothetical protein
VSLTPSEVWRAAHERLKLCQINRASDFEPYGLRDRDRDEPWADCSCGCRFFIPVNEEYAPADWGVCSNPASPRAGLLTWEHQGCPQFESEEVQP